ncbi:MAG: hypothetical protein JKY27_03335 [Magnetovibrio sp.]|nr:hypothetical protein [Magnetovibrio sp.]
MKHARNFIYSALALSVVLVTASPSSALTISFDLVQEKTDKNNDDAWWYAGKCKAVNTTASVADTEIISVVDLKSRIDKFPIDDDETICFVGHGAPKYIGTNYDGAAIAKLLKDYVKPLKATNSLIFYSCNAGKTLGAGKNLITATADALGTPKNLKITGATGACAAHPAETTSPFLVSYNKDTGKCTDLKVKNRAEQAYKDAGVADDPCNAGASTDTAGNIAFATCIYSDANINTAMDAIDVKDSTEGCLFDSADRSKIVTIP